MRKRLIAVSLTIIMLFATSVGTVLGNSAPGTLPPIDPHSITLPPIVIDIDIEIDNEC